MSMDIKGMVGQGVGVAFDVCSQLLVDVTLSREVTGDYDTDTGTVTSTEESVEVKGIFVDAKNIDSELVYPSGVLGNVVEIGDKVLLVKPQDVTIDMGNDLVVSAGSETWSVVDFVTDPTGNLYEIHVRGTKR